MRPAAFVLLAGLFGCSPTGALDPGMDAGLDAPDAPDARDGGRPGPDVPDGPDAPPPLEYTLEHGPAWDEPCAPWDIEPYTLARGLPADTTVRQLWHWNPTTEPDLFEFNALVSAPAIGRDGSLYVVFGGENQRLARLDRDGAVLWTHDFGVQLWEPPAILPDGDLVVVLTSTSAFLDPTIPRTVFRMSAAGTIEASWSMPGGRHRTQVSVGPDGRVYLTNGAEIYATCRAERIAWTLRVSEPRFWWWESYVEDDETLRVDADYEYPVVPRRISPRGELLEHPWPFPEDARTRPGQSFRRLGARVAAAVLLTAETSRSYLLAPDAGWRPLSDDGPTPSLGVYLDPAGGAWTYSRARTLTRYLDDRTLHVHTRGELDCMRREPWYEDGSLLCFEDGVTRVAADTGEDLWRVRATTSEGLVLNAADIAVDRTGRLYVSNFNGLFAFQTDALPPADDDGCAMPWRGCNERRDGAAVRWTR